VDERRCGVVQLGRRAELRVASGDEGEQVVGGSGGVVELGSVGGSGILGTV
jgi:hypothetical protein